MYSLESPRRGDSNEYIQQAIIVQKSNKITKLSPFAPWTDVMINPQWFELPISLTNFHGPKRVRATEVRLYLRHEKKKRWETNNEKQILYMEPHTHTQRRITTETTIKRSVTIQSTLVISNSKALAETLRDIRTSTYQILRISGKITRKPHLTNLYVIGLLKLEIYQKIVEKRRNCS